MTKRKPDPTSDSSTFDPAMQADERVILEREFSPSDQPFEPVADPNELAEKPRMKEHERAIAQAVAQGKSVAQASRDAGVSESAGQRAVSRDHVRAYMIALMDDAGLDDKRLLGVLDRGLDAEKFGLTKDGAVVPMGLDHMAITKYLDQALKLRDRFPDPRTEIEHRVSGAIVLKADDLAGIDPFSNAEVVEGEVRELT